MALVKTSPQQCTAASKSGARKLFWKKWRDDIETGLCMTGCHNKFNFVERMPLKFRGSMRRVFEEHVVE